VRVRPFTPLSPFARARSRWSLRRRPFLWWLAVVALAGGIGLLVQGGLAQAQADARRFGSPVTLAVARIDLPPGRVLRPDDVDLRPWPSTLVPRGAFRGTPDGLVVTQAVLAGEPLVRSRVSATGLVPTGGRAMAVPVGPGALGVRPGDRVDVLATFDPLVAPEGEDPTVTVASAATVVSVRPRAVTVAVEEQEAPRVAFALSQATIALALTPPDTFDDDDARPGSSGP
jgi:Flp pilus assembly protein CpaB